MPPRRRSRDTDKPPSEPLGRAGIQRHKREEPEAGEEINEVGHDSTLLKVPKATSKPHQISIGKLGLEYKGCIKERL
jgi:hypothetical protein